MYQENSEIQYEWGLSDLFELLDKYSEGIDYGLDSTDYRTAPSSKRPFVRVEGPVVRISIPTSPRCCYFYRGNKLRVEIIDHIRRERDMHRHDRQDFMPLLEAARRGLQIELRTRVGPYAGL